MNARACVPAEDLAQPAALDSERIRSGYLYAGRDDREDRPARVSYATTAFVLFFKTRFVRWRTWSCFVIVVRADAVVGLFLLCRVRNAVRYTLLLLLLLLLHLTVLVRMCIVLIWCVRCVACLTTFFFIALYTYDFCSARVL